ncbi:sugar ABC transporter permease [Treponema sp. HNW]|uniref:carbohydrate ABC transporter permease n=1 Tax=Treponema sp. HNW TaxID=3116654 RepID=UPI003D1246BF
MAQRKSLEKKITVWAWLFVTPALLFFAVFSFYPIANAFYLSFCNKNMISLKPPVFIGFANYLRIFSSPDFWNSVRATAVFTVGTFVPLVAVSLILAAFLTFRPAGSRILQLIYYSPAVLSSVVAALIWKLIFEPRGIANQFANTIMMTSGVDFKWLSNGVMLQISTMVVYFWKYIGYFTVLFLTGLGKIPKGIYEAALIDGASRGQTFFRITLPLLKPTTALVSIMAMLQCLKTFSTQYLFTQAGSPLAPINVITLNIYNTAMRNYNVGRASVMSVILFLFMLCLTIVQLRVSRSEDVSY